MIEDFAYAKLTSEVLSYLPDELKDRLSMLSLAKAARRYRARAGTPTFWRATSSP